MVTKKVTGNHIIIINQSNPTKNMISLTITGGYSNANGFGIRDSLKNVFVSWQNNQINRTN